MNCSVNLTRCDKRPISQRTRSHPIPVQDQANEKTSPKIREKHVSFENVPFATAKRTRRFANIPASFANENAEPSASMPNVSAKRKSRHSSTMPMKLKTTSLREDDNSLSSIIAMNCKLTNEVLLAKKPLSEQSEALLKMHQTLLEKSVECQDLRSEVQELQQSLERMRDERFCNDLIELEDKPEEAHG